MNVVPIFKPVSVMIGVFNSATNINSICLGDGMTKAEAISRAVDIGFTEEEIQNIVSVYGNDLEGLYEWFIERGIYLSEPLELYSDKKRRGQNDEFKFVP